MTTRSARLPDNAVLVHIGAYKTGTTAIQGALFQARPQLAEHGVLHAGPGRQPAQAVLAIMGLRQRAGKPMPRIKQWQRLADEVTSAVDKRVIVSSEYLGTADVETARRAVRDLGGPRVHVVVTLRPLAKIMPSQWQQYVRTRATTSSYDGWLEGMLRNPPYTKPTPSFWERHSHDVLVERWASIVGPENVTVIVPDEADRNFLLRTFEELVGLPSGLLVAESNTENRSLTLGEIELVRQLNIEFLRRDWPGTLCRKVVREGIGFHMQINRTPLADEPRITTPQWALDRAAEIGAEVADKLSALGVNIVGDISTLGARTISQDSAETSRANVGLPVDAAREAVVSTILSAEIPTFRPVESTSGRELLRIVLKRAWSRGRRPPARKVEAP